MTLLVAMAGLPGVGKSAVASGIAKGLGAVHLAVDAFEDATIRSGLPRSFETGLSAYLDAEVAARACLRSGASVVVDACNGVEEARSMWRALAAEHGADLRWVQVTCSDAAAHRRRLEARVRSEDATVAATWDDVVAAARERAPWSDDDRARMVSLDAREPAPLLVGTALRWLGAGLPQRAGP